MYNKLKDIHKKLLKVLKDGTTLKTLTLLIIFMIMRSSNLWFDLAIFTH